MMDIPLVLHPFIILLGAAALIPIVSAIGRRVGGERMREVIALISLLITFYSLIVLYDSVTRFGDLRYSLEGFLPVNGGVELYVDLFSVYMAFIFCGVGFLVALYSLRYMEKDTGLDYYYLLLLILVAGMVGVAFSGDFFNLFIFWEMMCISSYALVSFRKHRWEPIEAGFKYLVMSTLGSLAVLYGISLLYGLTGTVNFQLMKASIASLSQTATLPFFLIIILILAGFGVTTSIVPFHSWLPDAHPAAPSSISAILSGVVIKTGVFAIGRSLFTLFNPTTFDYGTIMIVFGVMTVTVANIMALLQKDVKRLLAYSSIVNIGFIITGLGIGAYALAKYYASNPGLAIGVAVMGVMGALFHLFNHAIGKGLLFLGSGCFVEKAKSRDIGRLHGIGRLMPWSGISFSIGLFSLAGVPPMAGFWSKFFIIFAGLSLTNDPFPLTATGLLILNSIFAAAYYLWLIQRIMLKTPSRELDNVKEAPLTMILPIVILASITVLIGVMPGLLIGFIETVSKIVIGAW